MRWPRITFTASQQDQPMDLLAIIFLHSVSTFFFFLIILQRPPKCTITVDRIEHKQSLIIDLGRIDCFAELNVLLQLLFYLFDIKILWLVWFFSAKMKVFKNVV